MCLFNVLAFLSKPERTYGSLTPQLEKVIIEVSTVQALRSRANPQNHTFVNKNDNMRYFFKTTANLSYDQKR